MVFQSGALFDSLTVGENVAFPLADQPGLTNEDIDEYVMKIARMLEVDDVLDKLPSELSTGMKRAVAIGRALAQNPEAILFDEPTTMVDPIMVGHMGELILRLKKAFHKTSIVVTHDTHLAKRLADVVVFLQDGRVTFFGPWADFENSTDPFLKNFRLLDELIPALDVPCECGRPGWGRRAAGQRLFRSNQTASQGDGLLGRPSLQHRHGAGAAMGRRGGAQRNFIDQFVDSCRAAVLCAFRAGDQ